MFQAVHRERGSSRGRGHLAGMDQFEYEPRDLRLLEQRVQTVSDSFISNVLYNHRKVEISISYLYFNQIF
jgi:hypothetical protein